MKPTCSPGFRERLETLFDGAQLNQCPNDPPCDQDAPLPHDEWCGVCLLITDIRKLLQESSHG